MYINLIINIPIQRDGATPYVEENIKQAADALATHVRQILVLNELQRQYLAGVLLTEHYDILGEQESPIASLGLLPYSATQPFPTPPNDQTALSDGHITNIYGTNPSSNPFRGQDPEFGGLSTQHTPQDSQSYQDFLDEVLEIPLSAEDTPENQNRLRLEAAKKAVDPQYYPGLEVMLNYGTTNDPYPDLKEIAPAVQAGYAFINHELQQFTETFLRKWLTNGLYPVQNPDSDIGDQCLLDFRSLGIGLDAETKVMGKDTRSKAIDTLLERVYDNWEMADESNKKTRRKEFHHHKDIGRKWCELVRYLGEGVLVVCGKDFDTKLANFLPAHNIHAVATFVMHCYPGILKVATYYQSVVRNFIRNRNLDDSQWSQWYREIRWDFVSEDIEKSRELPVEPVRWERLPDRSKDTQLSGFIHACLNSPEEANITLDT